jgi:hypothetical protein
MNSADDFRLSSDEMVVDFAFRAILDETALSRPSSPKHLPAARVDAPSSPLLPRAQPPKYSDPPPEGDSGYITLAAAQLSLAVKTLALPLVLKLAIL